MWLMSRYRELAHSHSGGADACYGGESVGLMCLIRLGLRNRANKTPGTPGCNAHQVYGSLIDGLESNQLHAFTSVH